MTNEEIIIEKLLDKIPLCSCGSDTDMECIYELLKEAENHTPDGFYRDKWFEFGAKVLDAWGFLDHGSSIGFAWLTPDGKLLLEHLRENLNKNE